MSLPRCYSCRFWVDGSRDRDDDDPQRPGTCLRYAPSCLPTYGGLRTAHPTTAASGWCGEHERCAFAERHIHPGDRGREEDT